MAGQNRKSGAKGPTKTPPVPPSGETIEVNRSSFENAVANQRQAFQDQLVVYQEQVQKTKSENRQLVAERDALKEELQRCMDFFISATQELRNTISENEEESSDSQEK